MGQNDDLFFAERIYKDAPSIFSWRPKSLQEIKEHCLIVVDANVLLAPYTAVSKKGLSLIAESYKKLINEQRMIVPGQAAREFARNRPNKLTELHHHLSDLKSRDLKINLNPYPLLKDIDEYSRVLESSRQVSDSIKEFRDALTQLLEVIESWEWNDPVSAAYEQLFDSNVVVDPQFNHEFIEKDLDWRKQNNLPPGYKDSGKIGDLLIWHTIMRIASERQTDLIFVTEETKPDWWHQSNNRNLYPRHELVEEYRRESGGASFHMLSFPSFLSLYGVDEEVVEQVRQAAPDFLRDGVAVISDGQILVIKHRGMYGAIQPIEQRTEPKEYIDYISWFLPDGSSDFNQPGVVQTHTGRARSAEVGDHIEVEQVQIGPMRLMWSGSSKGTGYVYLDRSPAESPRYDIAVLNETDISQVDASQVNLLSIRTYAVGDSR